MVSGRLVLVEKEIMEKYEKTGDSNFAPENIIISLLDSPYRPSIIYIISYILINCKLKFFENCEGKFVKGLEIRHSDQIGIGYIWFIHKNEDEISLEKDN